MLQKAVTKDCFKLLIQRVDLEDQGLSYYAKEGKVGRGKSTEIILALAGCSLLVGGSALVRELFCRVYLGVGMLGFVVDIWDSS